MSLRSVFAAGAVGFGLGAAALYGFSGAGSLAAAESGGNAMTETRVKELVSETLLNDPEIIVRAMERYEEILDERKVAGINENLGMIEQTPMMHVAGNPDAKVTVVEFFDYQCGFCKVANPTVQDILANDKDVKVAFVEYPILSEESNIAALAALAAQKQGKYLELHMALMQSQGGLDEQRIMDIAQSVGLNVEKLKADMDSEEVQAALDGHLNLAQAFQLDGTPAFLVNGQPVFGWNEERIRALIDQGKTQEG